MRRVKARMASTRKGFAIVFLVSLVTSTAIGLAVYNLDNAYIASKFDLVSYVPDRILAGSDASILIMAMDHHGNPMAGKPIEVKLVTGNSTQTLWSGRTDSDGFASPVFKAPSESSKADIVVASGPEEIRTSTVIDDTIRIIITTDKPVYQPGQTMHMRVLSFSGADPLPEQLPLILEVIDPNGDKIFKKQLAPNEFGISSYDLALSDQMIQGTYTIKAYSGERSATKVVIIKDYVLPKFRVELLGMQDWYLIGTQITGIVDAEYFFGEMVQGSVKMNASVYYGVWTSVYKSSGDLALGQYQFSIPPIQYAVGIPEAQGNGYLQINVSVTDTGGHTETRSKVVAIAPQSLAITVLTDSCVTGQYSTFKVIVRTPDGKPVNNTTIFPRLIDVDSLSTNLPPVITDSRGIASVTFLYEGQKTAVFGRSLYSYDNYVSVPLGDGSGVKVITDRPSYSIGDLGKFEIVYSGKSLTSNVYYDVVSRGFVIDRGVAQLSNGEARLDVQMVAEMEPFAQVRVYKIESNMTVVRDSVTFSVGSGSDLSVQVTADNSSYYPRDTVGISFKTATGGQPIVAALGISIVDEAVFELSSMFTGFEAIMFGLDEQFVQPQYQILSYVYAGAASLPSVGDEVVPELDTGRMEGTWAANKADAAELKESAIQSYWISLYLIAGIGLIGLCAWGVRRGRSALLVIALILIVPTLMLTALQSLVFGYGGTSSQQQPVLFPKGAGPALDNREFFGLSERVINEKPAENTQGGGYTGATRPMVIRNYFPETWYWNPCLVTGNDGVANISLQAPDSITSWKVDVIASTLDGLVGSGNGSVKVFQPFFIDPDIPVSVIRGDMFPMKVQVYNYLDKGQTVDVTLVQEPWFTLHSNASQQLYLPSGSVSHVEFTIQASMVGWRTITLQASAGNASDVIVKPMRIVPDGTKKETLVNGQIENGTATKTLLLDPSRIEGSENAWVKLQGGMEAVLLEGVDAFIQFVTGCGEQSLSTLSIDILAYDTVRQMNTAPEKLFSYESIVNQGIQHELMYLTDANNGKGRGIVWFPGDQDVHPWLTSWGLIAFQDAVNAGFGLDDKVIADMQSWLMSIQGSDGSWKFPDWGIYEFNNPILKAKTISSTAYIARALLYSGIPGSNGHVTDAINYIEKHVNEVWNDSYSLALSLLVLHDGGVPVSVTANIAQRLDSLKHVENGTCYWSSDTNLISDSGWGAGVGAMDMWGGYSSSRVIETTGYAAMALFGEGGFGFSVEGAIKYLLDHRQSLGGWYSTQDTIVAFQTLKRIASGSTIEQVVAKVLVEGAEIFSVDMGAFNRDVTYYVDLRPYLNATTNVSVACAGKGTLLYSIYLVQYVPWPAEAPTSPYLTLRVTYDATHIQLDDTVTAHVYLLYSGPAPALKMILVDLRAPMGLSFVLSQFDSLKAAGNISSYDSNDRQVVVYLTDAQSGKAVEFNYALVPLMPIKSTVQDICAWDMYDPNTMRAETLPVQFDVS